MVWSIPWSIGWIREVVFGGRKTHLICWSLSSDDIEHCPERAVPSQVDPSSGVRNGNGGQTCQRTKIWTVCYPSKNSSANNSVLATPLSSSLKASRVCRLVDEHDGHCYWHTSVRTCHESHPVLQLLEALGFLLPSRNEGSLRKLSPVSSQLSTWSLVRPSSATILRNRSLNDSTEDESADRDSLRVQRMHATTISKTWPPTRSCFELLTSFVLWVQLSIHQGCLCHQGRTVNRNSCCSLQDKPEKNCLVNVREISHPDDAACLHTILQLQLTLKCFQLVVRLDYVEHSRLSNPILCWDPRVGPVIPRAITNLKFLLNTQHRTLSFLGT